MHANKQLVNSGLIVLKIKCYRFFFFLFTNLVNHNHHKFSLFNL